MASSSSSSPPFTLTWEGDIALVSINPNNCLWTGELLATEGYRLLTPQETASLIADGEPLRQAWAHSGLMKIVNPAVKKICREGETNLALTITFSKRNHNN